MKLNCVRYSFEIAEFLNVKTLEEIDYGILDLSDIRDSELKEVFLFLEEILKLELKINYLNNNTGLFRVRKVDNKYCYTEYGYIIVADSIPELKKLVLDENRIWYVFDDVLARKLI